MSTEMDDSAVPHHRVRLMCSFGGRILPRPHDQQLRYVGGDTRMIAISRSSSFSTLLSKLSLIAGSSDQISLKYQLPNEDLDSLVSLTSDEDLDNMLDEYDRISASRTPRLRLFLFQPDSLSPSGSKSDDWFLDALNGSGPPSLLDRTRSEVSSIVSEVPDYLFGFDNNSDETPAAGLPDLYLPEKSAADTPPFETSRSAGYGPNPVWHYVPDQGPVYYVPGPLPVQPAQMSFPYAAHPVVPGQGRPFGYPVQIHGGPVYVGGPPPQVMAAAYEYSPIQAVPGEAYEMVGGGRGLIRHPTVMNGPMYQTLGVAPAGAEILMAAGAEFKAVRRLNSYESAG